MEISQEQKTNIYRGLMVLLVVLSAYFAVRALSEFRAYGMMGGSDSRTITMTGTGEVTAIPDIASVYFSINKEAKTVKVAQDAVAEVEGKVLAFLKEQGIEDKDIKASSVSFNPKYAYPTRSICNEFSCPPYPGNSVIVGYEASESITVKIRNTDDAGKIIEGLGALGVSSLNGPNFTIDDEDGLKAEARKQAIDEARVKAEILAKDLGVRLGKVAEFNESGNYPMYYGRDAMMTSVMPESAPKAMELPKGENTIRVDVTITYEIK